MDPRTLQRQLQRRARGRDTRLEQRAVRETTLADLARPGEQLGWRPRETGLPGVYETGQRRLGRAPYDPNNPNND